MKEPQIHHLEKRDSAASESDASCAHKAESRQSLKEALHAWPRAIFWSILFSSTIIMEGYDVALLYAFWGFPAFQKQFGHGYEVKGEIKYQVPASWQSGTHSAVLVMNIVGILISGYYVERYGYKRVFIASLCLVTVLIFGTFFSESMSTLFVAEALLGLPWGAFSTLGPAYASEVAPLALRGYLTTYVNICWIIGQLIATGVLKALSTRTDEWSYRIPFGLQWFWPVPIMIALLFAPESPWHYIRHDRLVDAKSSLERLCKSEHVNVDQHLALMIQTNELERRISSGTRYIDCFRGIDLRRTEVSCFAWAIQTLCGNPFSGQAIYFFTVAGISTSTAYSLGIGIYSLGLCGTLLSWLLLAHFGRRTIFLYGLMALTILMFTIGCAAIPSSQGLAQASLMIVWVFIYDLTVGPVAYSLVTELSSTRLRAKTVGLGRVLYNITGLLSNLIQPYFLNPTSLNLQGRIGFIWSIVSLICTIWTFYRLPEPRGRTYQELDIMFNRRIAAREFERYIL